MGFNRRKLEDQRRQVAEKEAASRETEVELLARPRRGGCANRSAVPLWSRRLSMVER